MKKDYAVYFFEPNFSEEIKMKYFQQERQILQKITCRREEASEILYLRPDLVKLDREIMSQEKISKRLNLSNNLYTEFGGIRHNLIIMQVINHLDRNRLGKIITENTVSYLIDAIREVKNDSVTIRMQNKFFDEVKQ
ncbi:MAG: hypothetical protein CM15mP102_18530 [Flavobacteriales bacterium]|nr:MAG: hypothetical protein CM15mP102_18530 [Flavobacteriales bacterium]